MRQSDPETQMVGPGRRCSAHSKTGERCKNKAVPGANVCRFHGGAAPQVKRRAALRLLELVEPAVATLAREMAGADKSSDRQRAANSILDRAGIARSQQVDVGTANQMLAERLDALREQAGLDPVTDDDENDDNDEEPR